MISLNLKNFCFRFLSKADRLISKLLIFLIILLRPLLGQQSICPFALGCTQFAILQLETTYLHQSLPAICKRLLSCNPVSIWMKNKRQR